MNEPNFVKTSELLQETKMSYKFVQTSPQLLKKKKVNIDVIKAKTVVCCYFSS